MNALTMLMVLATTLVVQVLDAAGLPVAGLPLRFQTEDGRVDQTCRTDLDGKCRFEVAAQVPIVRGTLTVGSYAQRDVTWSGTSMVLTLRMDALAPDTESRPYDDPTTPAASAPSWAWAVLFVLSLFVLATLQRRAS